MNSTPTLLRLEQGLQSIIPEAALQLTDLPQVPEISLYLLADNYPQGRLTSEQAEAIMLAPPYWCFCWASGQVLARAILDDPELVQGKSIVDFGCGSGVVAIAAAAAGAAQVIACDLDRDACEITRVNAALNRRGSTVEIEVVSDYRQALQRIDRQTRASVITVADVFYDRDNLPLLTEFQQQFDEVLISDCRLGGRALEGMSLRQTRISHTVPDLNESDEFNHVNLYLREAIAA